MKIILPPFLRHRFTLSGLNLERFLNTMQKEEIRLLRVRRTDHRTLKCECSSSDLERISMIVQEKGWRLSDARPVGLGAWLKRLWSRPGLVIGGVLTLALLLVAMQYVWLIRVEDAGPYQADIATYLEQEGYRPGMRKTQADAKTLSLLLQRRYPDVAWFRVYVSNVTLVVECTQGVPEPQLPASVPADLLALRDGVVESVQVYAGTALVRAGDLVRKGQVLIQGVERGADEQQVPVAARGVVMARCWEETTVRVPLRETLSRETGRKSTSYQICTPWFCVPEEAEVPEYLTYHLSITDTPVVGSFFPCWRRVSEYREVALEYGVRDVTQVRREAEDAARKALHRKLRGYALLEEWMALEEKEDGYVYATASAEWLTNLCRTEEDLP